ncbi:MAG: 4Fe-4S binding protein [Candidatus Bathyarchaeia archaeon]
MSSSKKIPEKPVAKPGFASVAYTGNWRILRPNIQRETCSKCMICWLYCPDGVIRRDQEGYPEIDYNFCKGCGICANECPKKAIEMMEESEV